MITLFIPYFGSFPNYFQLYLDSLKINDGILTVILITDINMESYSAPPNLRVIPMSLEDLRIRIHHFLKKTFGKAPPPETLVQTPYKLVDFKVTYPLLFEDLCNPDTDNYVGWGDIDVIYGDLHDFVVGPYDIIGGWHGHFTAIRPTTAFKTLFTTVPQFYDLCTDAAKTYVVDEIAFRAPLEAFIKTHELKMCYLNTSFCDIVPPCFYDMFRPDHATFTTNFFNVAKPRLNISRIHRSHSGSITTFYDDRSSHETSYVHLQKRVMALPEKLDDAYIITESEFMSVPNEVPANLFMTWFSKTLPPLMQENVDRIRQDNPEIQLQLFDDKDCEDFMVANYPVEVAAAFRALRPGAYKADLWRLCVLYKLGGIYMDIKLQLVGGFKLSSLLTQEYFVSDGTYTDKKGKQRISVYNGFIVAKAGNPFLLKAIVAIVVNVSRRFYGYLPYDITGPSMLGLYYTGTFELAHYGPKNAETIRFTRNARKDQRLVTTHYGGYRKETESLPYYETLWANKQVYDDTVVSLDVNWPPEMKTALDEIISGNKIRLHLPAIPYTITRSEYSHDAFTGKVLNFSPMMRSNPAFEVFHYGVETSESGADRDIQLFTKEEWNNLRIESMMSLHKELTREQAAATILDPKTFVGTLSQWNTPLFKEFNRRLREALNTNYRSQQTDIVCVPLGRTHEEALVGLPHTVVEFGIGYSDSYKNFRVFESYSWLSHNLGKQGAEPNNYWFVIPYYFNVAEFAFSENPKTERERPRIGFLGRILSCKGCHVIAEIAKRFPDVDFVLCGQGDPAPFQKSPNVLYKPPIHGRERSDFLGSCVATICATTYCEPFGCSAVESQLCGTPVISVDTGGYVETVEQFKTGLRCHTLADFCKGVQMALDGAFDRAYVRRRAVGLYDMYALAKNYEYVFRSVLDIYTPGKNGWYSPDKHIECLNPSDAANPEL